MLLFDHFYFRIKKKKINSSHFFLLFLLLLVYILLIYTLGSLSQCIYLKWLSETITAKGNQIKVYSSCSYYASYCIFPVDLIMSFEISFLKWNSLRCLAVYLTFLFWNQTCSSSSLLFMWCSVYFIQKKKKINQNAKLAPPFLNPEIQLSLFSSTIWGGSWLWSHLLMLCGMILNWSKKTNIIHYSLNFIFQFNPRGIIVADFLQTALVAGHKQALERFCDVWRILDCKPHSDQQVLRDTSQPDSRLISRSQLPVLCPLSKCALHFCIT